MQLTCLVLIKRFYSFNTDDAGCRYPIYDSPSNKPRKIPCYHKFVDQHLLRCRLMNGAVALVRSIIMIFFHGDPCRGVAGIFRALVVIDVTTVQRLKVCD